EAGYQSDLEVALFDLVARSKEDFERADDDVQQIGRGFAAGYNAYLAKHPEVKPALLERMEPFHVLAYSRFMILGRLLGAADVSRRKLASLSAQLAADEQEAEAVAASLGSNQWALAPSRTASGNAMLFINPHQPWYGSGMFTEMHVLLEGEGGFNFSGTMFPGSPIPTAGFSEYLGWAYTVNEADISDVYRVTFDHPTDRLKYRYGDGWREATEWPAAIRVKTDSGLEERTVRLRRTHHGPVLSQENAVHYLAVRVPRLYDGDRTVQALAQIRSRNFDEWYAAVSQLHLQTFNTMYADRDGNIFYLYNGTMARRDPSLDWRQPVDGSDPATEWGEFHPVEELPQVLNPPSGFVQNCNSTPFTTTDDGNPSLKDFPSYMVKDKHDDKRRAKMARYLLRRADKMTFEEFQDLAYDTTLYWPMTEIPVYAKRFEALQETHPELAKRVEPYLRHFDGWDYRATIASTQANLAVEWYEQLYGRGYPVETLKPEYLNDIPERFAALERAAKRLEELYGSWKVPYGDVHRLQRQPFVRAAAPPFADDQPSLPLAGVRGPLGVAFTVYHSPPGELPDGTMRKQQFAGTGASYMAVYEFGERTRGMSYLHYGQSHRPESPHFFDQAKLLSERRFKTAYLYWDDVEKHTERQYRPE
ncbi:MAG: penicillin acylase family protein, partial [Acidobacteriota bacterium]